MSKKGKVWLVGAGPSDAGLLTLKGKAVLENADVVIYDKLVGESILAWIPSSAKKINVGKSSGNHPVPQKEINQMLLKEALDGNHVVRLKGGDPFLFGRGGEELELLIEHRISFEVIPGITSAIAVSAYAGIPVTHRDYSSSLHIISAHKKKGSKEKIDYKKLAVLDGTLVFLMGVSVIEQICSELIQAGMDRNTPAAVIENGTTAQQRSVIGKLADLFELSEKEEIQTPAIIVVGKVCSLAKKFEWKNKRELNGVRVIVTRPRKQSSSLIAKLLEKGAEVVELPSIKTESLETLWEDSMEKVVKNYQWIVFASEAAVNSFFESMIENQVDIRSMSKIKFAVVGSATAKALEARGIRADYMPQEYNGKNLGEGLCSIAEKEEKFLIFTPFEKESPTAAILMKAGFFCRVIENYKTVYEKQSQIILRKKDYVAFTSASTVKGFVQSMSDYDFEKVNAVCIGTSTAKEALEYGMKVTVAKETTIDSLILAIKEASK